MYAGLLRPARVGLAISLLLPGIASAQKLVTAGGPGTSPAVRVFDASGTDQTFLAYPAAFPGGVRVALGDVTGDGVLDIITGAGPGGGPHVRVWNGTDLTEVGGFFAYDPAFPGGVFVAAGDVNGDGKADIITGAGPGGGPHVRIWDGATFAEIGGFFAYDPAFPGGVTVAAGDVDGDGRADIVTGAGPGGGPHVRVWSGADFHEIGGFFAYDPAFPGGVNVAAGDIDGDGRADIVTGAGPGGGPHVRVWSGADFHEIGGFFAYDPGFPGGVVVGTVDLDRDGKNELVTGPANGSPLIRLWSGTTFTLFGEYFAYDPALGGNGVFVGSASKNPSTDDAPRVDSTVPANNATGVAVDADLTVTFSEAVTAGVGAFVLECPVLTPIALTTVTASPATTFTLHATTPLPLGTACTLRVVATQITDDDTDDPPDAMTADVTVSFTTSTCTPITVSPTTVPGGNVNVAYVPVTFTQVGGTAPITWTVSTGTLPTGMMLSPSGVLSGTPTQVGAFPLTITATATGGCTGSVSLTLNIAAGPNQAPSFTIGPNQTLLEDAGARTVANWATAINPGAPDEAAQVLTFNITGNTNAALFSAGPAVSTTGTLTYTPAANANGSATITLVLHDNGGTALGGVDTSAPQTFTITVTAVNDAPSFAVGPNQTVAENAGPQTVTPWAIAITPGPANEAAQTVAFNVTGNTNPALFSAGPAVSPTGTLTYTPAPNASGTAMISITLQDNGGTANGGVNTSPALSFTITVTGVNTAPSFIKGADQTVFEDAGAQTVAGWATAIDPGGPDEAGQTLTFNITGNTNAALFSAGPAVSPTGTLTYTPAPNASGTATITLTLSDNGGTAGGGVDTSAPQTFAITVTAVNDAPSFAPGANPTSAEDAGPQSIANWATAISAGPADEAGQTLAFAVTNNTNAALFSVVPAVSPTGTLTYTSAPNAFGSADITLVLQDSGGTANGGVNTSAPVIFTITITSVNDSPALTVPIITYATAGNTQLHVAGATRAGLASIADASSILTKSIPTDIDGPTAPAVVAFTGATTNGTATLNADGSFTYVPNAGFTGTDSFTFQVTDGLIPVSGTLQVTVGPRVWYVSNLIDADNAAGGDGRSTDAFDTLTAAETASAANDIIFVFNGDSQTTPLGGITLKNGVKLHGEGIGLTVAPFGTIVPAGTAPRLTGVGDTIAVLANTANGDRTGVEIRGLNLSSTGGNAIDVTSANTQVLGIRISENTIAGATLAGIDINQGSSGAATLAVHDNTITAGFTGLAITRTAGTITITEFDDNVVSGATGGTGIMVTGPSVTFDANPGGSFDVVSGGTTVIGQSGNGVGGAGLVLSNVSGDLSFVDLNVVADNGAALFVGGTGAINVGAGTGTRLTAGGGDLHAAAGPAVSVNVATIDLQLASMSASTATNGLVLTNVNGTFSAPPGSVITKSSGTGAAVFVDNSAAGTAVLTATYGGTVTNTSSTGRAITINSADAGSTLTFTGAVTDNPGQGIALTGNTGATITFSGGLTLSTGTNPAFTATGGGTIAVTGGSNTVNASGATALDLANVTIGAGGFTLQSTSSGGGTRNVKLTSLTGGAIALGTGALSGATGAAFLVGDGTGGASTGGTAAISYGGTITAPGTARAVDIQDRSAGAGNITLSGAISHTSGNANVIVLDGNAAGTITFSGTGSALNGGTATAVSLTNNTGATINFTGNNLDIDATSGGGFQATGGGTVNVTGTGHTITTTTGTALNVANTTIGASGLTFQSISANGATNGIVLNTTGAGALTVSGNAAAGTGGTITASTGPGISLTSTGAVNLSSMNIQNSGDDGIRGNGVVGFNLTSVNITGNGNAVGERGIDMLELTGSGGMTTTTVSGSGEHNVRIANTTGTLTAFNVTGSTFSTPSFVTGDDGFLVEQNGTGTMNLNITGNTFTDNKGDHFQVASQASAAGAINFTFSNNTLTTTAIHDDGLGTDDVIGGGITISPSGSTDVTFTISNNNIQQAFDDAINLNLGTASTAAASLVGTISNNTIGNALDVDSGSESSNAITVTSNGAGTTTVAVTGNLVRQYGNGHGIMINAKEGSSTLNATVTANTVSNPGTFAINGIRVDAGATSGPPVDSGTTCAVVTGNNATGSGLATDDIRLRQRFNTTIRLPGYVGATNDAAAVNAFVAANNDPPGPTLPPTVSSVHNVGGGGGGFVGGSVCAVPQ